MKLADKDAPETIKVALIENAADVYEENRKAWMYDDRRSIQACKFQVDLVDLNDYRRNREGLLERLGEADIIWLGGGNVYYLRWMLKETGADSMIIKLVRHGKVYGGGSAGAIIAGPTINYFQSADEPGHAPEIILDGLGFTETVVIPHWANEKYGYVMESIKGKLQEAQFKTVEINDEQALVISDEKQSIIG